jgi:hypothetical protein
MNSFLYILFLAMGLRHGGEEFLCRNTTSPVNIDALLTEKDWDLAKSITILDRFRKKSDNKMEVRTLWDEQNLYISFQVWDKDLQARQREQDHPLLAQDDMVEFLIDTRNKKDSCWNGDDVVYHINILGQKKDDRGSDACITNPVWNGNAHYAVKLLGTVNDPTDKDTGFVVEVSISWKELDLTPREGMRIGIDFANGDSGKMFDWVGATPFRSPYAFGNLILTK